MTRMRSPSYPSVSLMEAIDFTKKIFDKSRTNAVDREAAAKDMGYSGITGRSLKVLAALIQYDLIEKAGKGGVRVTQTFKDISHGLTDEVKKNALLKAGTSPTLYQDLLERFPDGPPSENALRSYLIQQDFANVAIGPAVSSFQETYRSLQDANVFDSHGPDDREDAESEVQGDEVGGRSPSPSPSPTPTPAQHGGYQVMEGERVVFSEEIGAANYLKLVANGEMNADLLDALQDFIKRVKKRLGVPAQTADEAED